MSKLLKELIVNELEESFRNADSFVVVDYKGIDHERHINLRQTLFDNNCEMQIVKNSLARIAFRKLGREKISDLLERESAIVLSTEDELKAAKVIVEWIRKNKVMSIRGGYVSGSVVDEAGVKRLAALPSREQLLAQVAGAAIGPLTATISCLANMMRNVIGCVENLREKREKEGQN